MRIDVFLHKVCLMKSRSMAAEACRRGKVRLNGEAVRPSQTVDAGGVLVLELASGRLEVVITDVPGGNVPRRDVMNYYRIVSDDRGGLLP